MNTKKLSDIDSNEVAYKCGEVLLKCMVDRVEVTAEALYDRAKDTFTEEEKDFMVAMFMTDKLKSFSKEQEEMRDPAAAIVKSMNSSNNQN